MFSSKLHRFIAITTLHFSLLNAWAITPIKFSAIMPKNDLRTIYKIPPFPLIFHYNQGGERSTFSECKILAYPQPGICYESMPKALDDYLAKNGIKDIQICVACCKLKQAICNYFTHTWSMDRMVENRSTRIYSGMYNPINLSAINGEVGVNSTVLQTMSFHDKNCLSGNVARFQINDMRQIASAWFVSYYDPSLNAASGNAPTNQEKKALVVFWLFFPPDFLGNPANITGTGPLEDVISYWDYFDGIPSTILEPQFKN